MQSQTTKELALPSKSLLTSLHVPTVAVMILVCNSGCRSLLPKGPEQILSDDPLTPSSESMPSVSNEPSEDETFDFDSHKQLHCHDNIYAKYLEAKFVEQEKPRIRAIRGYRSRRRAERDLKYHVSHHINERIDGPHAPYFGGLPVVETPKVEIWLNYFQSKGRTVFMKWLVRSKSYEPLVVPLLQEQGLPRELFFLAMIESGFSNTASSRVRATGTWQFMKRTAKHYGLKIDYWVDERRDPVKSTLAAARYLKELYARFGDWYLAIAAYNAGPGKVQRAIRRTKSRDFWELARSRYLRSETKHYVPKMLAALIIASNPEKYGFSISPDLRDMTPVYTVSLDKPRLLKDISLALDIRPSLLKRWNPELLRGVTPPLRHHNERYQLRLPKIVAERFEQVEKDLQSVTIEDVKMYKIRRGDTLSDIARRHNIPMRKILELNPRLHPRRLRPGRRIAIPVPAVIKRQPKETA